MFVCPINRPSIRRPATPVRRRRLTRRRTRMLHEAPILPPFLRLSLPNVLNLLAIAVTMQ